MQKSYYELICAVFTQPRDEAEIDPKRGEGVWAQNLDIISLAQVRSIILERILIISHNPHYAIYSILSINEFGNFQIF